MAYLKTLSPSCGFTDVLGYFADRFLLYNGTHLVFKVNIHFFLKFGCVRLVMIFYWFDVNEILFLCLT